MNAMQLMAWGAAVGLGATILTDLIGVFRQGWPATHGFYCLVGRWVGSIPLQGIVHNDIRNSPPLTIEAGLGWSAHIVLGLLFGMGFVALFGPAAISAPKLWEGLSFGLATVVLPWLVFQPFFGWGVAASKAPEPWSLRLRGLITHGIFGLGLWVSAMVAASALISF